MRRIVLVGGTGAAGLCPPGAEEVHIAAGRYGAVSGSLRRWRQGAHEVLFLPRHGIDGTIPPHRVNYRANVDALRGIEPEFVIGVNAVGGITPEAWPGRVVLPGQLIDYTWGREHTFFDGHDVALQHVDFDPPFDESLRQRLLAAGRAAGVDVLDGGTYGVTQGPRLETAAEIDRLDADGCDVVGMTAMPEAALAREAGLRYAICAVVVNRAAGRLLPGSSIHAELSEFLAVGMRGVQRLIGALFTYD